MKEWIKAHKNEIITGVIASIITAGVLKFGNILLKITPVAGTSLFTRIRDYIYYSAGKQASDTIASAMLSFLIGIIIAPSIVLAVRGFKIIHENELLEIANGLMKDPNGDKAKAKVVEKKLTAIIAKKEKRMSSKSMRASFVFMLLYMIVFLTAFFAFIVTPSTIWHEFELNVTQITPYIEEVELQELRSKWVSMKTKSDFDAINQFISEIQTEHALTKIELN